MEKKNIRIFKEEGNKKTELVGIKPLRKFSLFGEKFFAHRSYSTRHDNKNLVTFVVSEEKTGNKVVSRPAKKLYLAIAEAKERLMAHGEESTKRHIEERVRSYGKAN